MGYFQDTRICETHGFVLTPEGTCVRCAKEANRSARLHRWAKVATGATVVVAAVCGITVARARVDTVVATPAPPLRPAAPALPVAPAPAPVVAAASPPPSEDWDVAMARAEAERQRAAAAQATAEKQRQVSAVEMPDPPPEDDPAPRAEPQAPETTDPMFAPTRLGQRVYRHRGGAGGAANNPASWGLPANNGGNFRNRGAGH